ncbi:hypothetical protein B0H14DRAFT_3426522 [Mycena olivaceomarginata]|nr:hypothetical protein B0H14DRAFT_3426522 [Mycena olivaceomarginata]
MKTSSVISNASDTRFRWYTFPGSDTVPPKETTRSSTAGATFNSVVAKAYNALFNPLATLDDELLYVVPRNTTTPAFAVVIGSKSSVIDPRDQVVAMNKDADSALWLFTVLLFATVVDLRPRGDVFFHVVVAAFNPVHHEITLTEDSVLPPGEASLHYP